MLIVMMVLMILVALDYCFDEIPKFWSDFGAGYDFLGVALVEYIDKGSIFGLESRTYR